MAPLLLAVGMCASAAFLLHVGRGLTFSGDELYYYSHLTAHGTVATQAHGLEYLVAPHNGHLVLVGRLIYEALFAIGGTDYLVFRIAGIAGILVSVALFFTIARRRVDPLLALAASLLLLFFGYAYESLLWPFDLHTVYALCFGLAAILALERDGRRSDALACLWLLLAVGTVELGLAFVVGVGVWIGLREDRWRRAWVVAVPLFLYAAWWLWARKFDQPAATLLNVHLIPIGVTDAFAAVTGSLTGINPTGAGVAAETTTVTPWAAVLAGIATVGLALRLRLGSVPPTLWVFAAAVLAYWVMIAFGGRPPDSARYLFVGAVLVLLVGADALKGWRLSPVALLAVFVVAALAIPANLAKLFDGRRLLLNDAAATRTEFAMLELARGRVDPAYTPGYDPRVTEAGGGVITAISAGSYFDAARDRGPLAFSLDQVRAQAPPFRGVADATLAGALRVFPRAAQPPPSLARCQSSGGPGAFALHRTGVLLGSRSSQPLVISVSRFETAGEGVPLASLPPRTWATLRIPADAARDPWIVHVDGSFYRCDFRR